MDFFALSGAPKIRYSGAGTNVVCDGDSLTIGQGVGAPQYRYPAQLPNFAPIQGTTIAPVNLGIGGQTWRTLNGLDAGSAADVDAAWAVGKTNILIAWAGTNDIWAGRTVAQTTQDARDYITARLALNAWRVVLLTSLPRFGTTAQCQALVDMDNYFRANYRAMGAHALCDVRADGSPFNFFGDVAAPFQATQSLWAETSNWVHLNNSGYPLIAQMVGRTLQRLSAK